MDGCNGLQSRAPLRVIVADDDALVRRVLRDVLQRAGIVVIAEAGGGREAVELSLYYKPDVVLMDLLMPGTDGIAATREILAAQPDAKIVMITSSAVGSQTSILISESVVGVSVAATLQNSGVVLNAVRPIEKS